MSEPQPLVQNASDPRQVRAAGKKVNLREKELMEQLRNVLGSRPGRKWYWTKMDEFRVFLPTFDPNPYQAAYNEGWRNAGLKLLRELQLVDPALEVQMRKESSEDNERGA